MISFIRRQMSATNLMVVAALIFAMAGGAFAAGGGGKHHGHHGHHAHGAKHKGKKTKAKGKRGPRGKQGPPGPAGETGATGPQGPQGPQGLKGDTGPEGKEGPQGIQGVEGKEGPKGDTGEAGMCSEANTECKLASGATLTGMWVTGGAGATSYVAISLPLRVSPAPTAVYPHTIGPYHLGLIFEDGKMAVYGPHPTPANGAELTEDAEAYKQACPGTEKEPKAAPGVLCVYEGAIEGKVEPPWQQEQHSEAANEFGLVMPFKVESESSQRGSWAVTAE